MRPTNLRDVLQRLSELQEIEQHLPREVVANRVSALVQASLQLRQEDPETFGVQLVAAEEQDPGSFERAFAQIDTAHFGAALDFSWLESDGPEHEGGR